MIKEFRGEYFFLSNYYRFPIFYNGKNYGSAEHLYQSMKCYAEAMTEDDGDIITWRELIRISPTPAESKRLGNIAPIRDDWDRIRDDVMRHTLNLKFKKNPDLMERLLATGNTHLLEGTTAWHDNYWGSCECSKCINKKGKNKLGILLMNLRNQIKER